MPTIVGGQHAVMPVAQLGNLGQVAIMSPSQVVVQQRNEFYLLFYCFSHTSLCMLHMRLNTRSLLHYMTMALP